MENVVKGGLQKGSFHTGVGNRRESTKGVKIGVRHTGATTSPLEVHPLPSPEGLPPYQTLFHFCRFRSHSFWVFFTGVTIFPTLILIFSDWYFYSTWSLKKYRIQVHKMFRKCDPSFFTCCPWNDFWKSSHQNSLQSWDTAACSPADSDGAHSPARGWETCLPFDWGQSRHIVL